MPKIALYARVSTNEQSTEMQLNDLRRYAQQRELDIYKEYVDEVESHGEAEGMRSHGEAEGVRLCASACVLHRERKKSALL